MTTPLPRTTFLEYFRFFRRLTGDWRLGMLFLVVLLTTWSEGVGIALLIPLLAEPVPGTPASMISRTLAKAGLPDGLDGVLIALVVVAFLKGLFTFLTVTYQQFLSAKMTQDLRRSLMDAISGVDYRYMLGSNTGTLLTTIWTQTAGTSAAFLLFSKLMPHVVTITVFTVILVFVDWRLTVIVGVVGIAASRLLRWPARASQEHSARFAEEGNVLTSLLIQFLQSFKYLASTATMDRLHGRIFASIRRLTLHGYRTGALSGLAYALPQPVVALFLAGVMIYQTRISGKGIAVGFVLLIYLYRMMNEILALQVGWQTFCAHTGAVDATAKMQDELRARRETSGKMPFTGLRESIELKDVTFSYDDRPVISSVSIRIPRHGSIALVGESGSGKTTIVDLVSGLLKPTEGAVLVDGVSLSEIDLASWRRSIGYVPQDPAIYEDTIANNITLWSCDPADPACFERIREAARMAHCDDFVSALPDGYGAMIGERGVKLSGGQRQRLAIARELFKNPALLILDEATSALDSESEQLIQQSIDRLRGRLTMLVIAHRLSTIKGSDRIYVLQGGQAVESGTFAELTAQEGSRFRALAKLQNL